MSVDDSQAEVRSRLRPEAIGTAAVLALLLALLVLCAWQADDAFITWRTVENAVTGHGLRWNPDERVQVYTHPLWMVVGLVCRLVSGELYFSVLVVSAGLTLGTAFALVRLAGSARAIGIAGVLALLTSRAVVDYSISGMENPLTGALVVSLAWAVAREQAPWVLTLLGSLLVLTRPDAVLLAAPVVARGVWRDGRARPALLRAFLGVGPLLAWGLFSLVYYGTLVPNTALAKLHLDLPRGEPVSHGFAYALDSLRRDPITLVGTAFCVGVALSSRRGGGRALAAGSLLFMAYTVWIGGDFMSGRFWMAPFVQAVAAAVLVCRNGAPGPRWRTALVTLPLLYGALYPHSPLHARPSYGEGLTRDDIIEDGIADERAYYYPQTGLLPVLGALDRIEARGDPLPPYQGALEGASFRRSNRRVRLAREVGYFGYFAGPERIVIDRWALCDPLLARIPYVPGRRVRIGHYRRPVPPGYVESREKGRNLIEDAGLRAAYEDVRRVVSGPVASGERWAAIWRLHTGAHREALRRASRWESGS